MELKGPDNSVRVRQIRVLGKIDSESLRIGKQFSSYTIQQKNCEAETLRVFRLITSQVFGKLIQGEEGQNKNIIENAGGSGSESLDPLEESNDLREHMVGILFSRSKLTHLQKQVRKTLLKIFALFIVYKICYFDIIKMQFSIKRSIMDSISHFTFFHEFLFSFAALLLLGINRIF